LEAGIVDSSQTPLPEDARVPWLTPRIEEIGDLAKAEHQYNPPLVDDSILCS
jgi:hypothetical protein